MRPARLLFVVASTLLFSSCTRWEDREGPGQAEPPSAAKAEATVLEKPVGEKSAGEAEEVAKTVEPAGLPAEGTAPLEAEFVTIFDGQSLAGWEAMPASTAGAWTVVDGVLRGDGDKGRGYLAYEKRDIRDLELEFSYRFPGDGNSGVSIRAVHDETGKREFKSYHADLGHVGIGPQVLGAWDFHTPGRKEHRCWRGERLVIDENDEPTLTEIEGGLTVEDVKKGDWNHVAILAQGDNFKFWINGKLAAEFTEHLPVEKRLERGMIQFQLHDPGMIVEFKDIRLKVFD